MRGIAARSAAPHRQGLASGAGRQRADLLLEFFVLCGVRAESHVGSHHLRLLAVQRLVTHDQFLRQLAIRLPMDESAAMDIKRHNHNQIEMLIQRGGRTLSIVRLIAYHGYRPARCWDRCCSWLSATASSTRWLSCERASHDQARYDATRVLITRSVSFRFA